MTRAERLLALLQVLRRHRRPVSGRMLAGELVVTSTVPSPLVSMPYSICRFSTPSTSGTGTNWSWLFR